MTESTRTINATCLCASAAHEITLPSSAFPLPVSICHCNSCRHMTGTLCFSAVMLGSSYKPSEGLLDKLTPFTFSKRITQYFCKQCGTHVIGCILEDPENPASTVSWDAATGTLETFDGSLEVQGHQHIADTLDGGIADFLPKIHDKHIERWAHHFRKGDQIPLYWRSPQARAEKTPSQARLHAHCKCAGVQFWIARPPAKSTDATVPWSDVLIPQSSGPVNLPENETWWLRANRSKFLAGLCACDSCRLAAGMEVVQWAFIPTTDITLDPEGKIPFSRQFGTLKPYRSSSKATRYFCDTCGATVFWHGDIRPKLIDVAVGLLDAQEGARAESWLEWRTERLSFREDALGRAESVVLGLENGMKGYATKVQGRDGPPEEVASVIDSSQD